LKSGDVGAGVLGEHAARRVDADDDVEAALVDLDHAGSEAGSGEGDEQERRFRAMSRSARQR
jgi:hypothetical protein